MLLLGCPVLFLPQSLQGGFELNCSSQVSSPFGSTLQTFVLAETIYFATKSERTRNETFRALIVITLSSMGFD